MHLMLRKTLPLWKPEETIEEVTDFCRRFGIDLGRYGSWRRISGRGDPPGRSYGT